MGMMLPDGLIWIMEKLDYEWPDINEDDLAEAANLTRTLRDDLESIIQTADEKIALEIPAAATGKAALAYTSAWQANRSQNLEKLLDILVPVPPGLDVAGGVVVGLKLKVIAQVTIDLATLAPLILAGPLGAAGFVAKKAASRIIMNMLVDKVVSEVIEMAAPLIIEPLTDQIPGVLEAILVAPEVEDTGAEPGELKLDTDAMEQIENAMLQCSTDMETAISSYVTAIGALKFSE